MYSLMSVAIQLDDNEIADDLLLAINNYIHILLLYDIKWDWVKTVIPTSKVYSYTLHERSKQLNDNETNL